MMAASKGKLASVGPSPEVAAEMLKKTPKNKKSLFAKAYGK